ncbi:MAG TPA: STAS domain-containing protein [Solirubrobacteraceae bacterium]
MDFPSKEAIPAARPLLRPRGGGAVHLGRWALRQMTMFLRPRTGDHPDFRSTSNSRTELVEPWFDITLPEPAMHRPSAPEPMMHRPPAGGFAIEETWEDGVHKLILRGELDARSAPALETAVARHFAGGPGAIAVDLAELDFIDSSGLWSILAAMRWCERQGRGFSLLPGPEPVQQVFEVTGLIDVLPFRSSASLG